MEIRHEPDAKQGFRLFGPIVRVMPFHVLGEQVSFQAEAVQLAVVREQGVRCGVIALGATLPGGTVVALHLNIDADHARRLGAQLIAAANELDSGAGVS